KVSGNIGDTFDVTTSEFKLDITGYTFARIEGTPTGTLSDQAQTVTYVYTKLKEEIVQPVKPEELTTLPKTGVGNGVLMMGTVISTLGLILVGRKKED
ncbi:MucBP domain-containing protein, partial [Erysipelothrix aquatica]